MLNTDITLSPRDTKSDFEKNRTFPLELPNIPRTPLISKETPIGAAGSCFAMEISNYFKKYNYNYIVTEKNPHSCAAWGTIFNMSSFRQLIEVAFGLRKRPKVLFECIDPNVNTARFWDPYREGVYFDSIEEYETNLPIHIAAAKEALMKAKVFIITAGLNELWRLNYDNSTLSSYPRTIAPYFVHKQVLSVEENINELQRMLDIWRVYNPDLKIIITVSPIPLHSTFRANESHVIAASCHSKSVLRIAVNQFVKQNPDCVYYFPAFEVVSYCVANPWDADHRHVSRETVQSVMSLFEQTFLI